MTWNPEERAARDRQAAERSAIEYKRRQRAYRKLVRENKDFALSCHTENDGFYLRINRKQAMECINSGMVATLNDSCICFIEQHDANYDFQE